MKKYGNGGSKNDHFHIQKLGLESHALVSLLIVSHAKLH
jgi:hypothetical protein